MYPRGSQPFKFENPTGLCRLGEAAEIASIVSWLANDESAFATGADFSINGGLHMG
jgi:NAD(P)-dependent dehydrogenase (short-subunit alcohol dehydrogenase family)